MSARRTKTGEVRLEDRKQSNRQREMAVRDARGGKRRRPLLINALRIAAGSANAYANAQDRVASGESRISGPDGGHPKVAGLAGYGFGFSVFKQTLTKGS